MPFALQTGEIGPKWLAGKIVREMDDTVDEDEAMLSGAIPIICDGQVDAASTGNPMTDPEPAGRGGRGEHARRAGKPTRRGRGRPASALWGRA